MNTENIKSENSKLPILDVRQRALEWWSKLPNKTKKSITDSNIDILMKGIPRTWQRLTGREIEKLYVVSHVA